MHMKTKSRMTPMNDSNEKSYDMDEASAMVRK